MRTTFPMEGDITKYILQVAGILEAMLEFWRPQSAL